MRKTLLVMRHEFVSTLARRSYLFFAFGIPLLSILILVGVKFIQARSGGGSSSSGAAQADSAQALEGFVDPAGMIRAVPENLDPAATGSWGLVPYPDEAEAQRALKSGLISAYYVIPPDYLETGRIEYVYPDSKSYLSRGQEWTIQWALTANLLENNLDLADQVWNPVQRLRETSLASASPAGGQGGEDCSKPGLTCRSSPLIRYLPAIMVVFLYISLMTSSSLLFNSVGIEKENRTIEVLAACLHPRQLLFGKTVALGLAGLLQTLAWLGAAYIGLNLGGGTLKIPENFSFPTEILFWSLLLFLGGYGLYAGMMAGAGALVPRLKEAGGANFIAMVPLMIAYLVGLFAPLADSGEALLPVVLSMFPLTAPVLMLMRLVYGAVPWWQLAIAIVGTYLTAYLILRAAGDLFRAQNLLSGQPFSLRRYFRLMVGMQ